MAMRSDPPTVSVTRRFQASPERVFDAWLDPVGFPQWMFRTLTGELMEFELEPHIGGRFLIVERRGEELAEHFGTFVELDRPRRLVFTFATNREATPTTVTVAITPVEGGCEVTLSHPLAPEWAAFADKARSGWESILSKLQETLMSDRELVIVREFAAPRELVWRVWTEPAHVAQWFGPRGFSTTVRESDLRAGGKWRYVMKGPDGSAFPFGGLNKEVVPFEKIVSTDEFECEFEAKMPAGELPKGMVVTVLFEDAGPQRTRVTIRVLHPTPEDKKKHEAMGVEAGWNSSFECMDDYLAAQATGPKPPPMIFVNLPVADLARATAFYTAIGFRLNPQYSDATASGMVLSDAIHVMLLTHAKFQEFSPLPIANATRATEVMNCLACESRGHLEATVRNAVAAGGTVYAEPKDYGFMFQHGFRDPDGHIWELVHMTGAPPA